MNSRKEAIRIALLELIAIGIVGVLIGLRFGIDMGFAAAFSLWAVKGAY